MRYLLLIVSFVYLFSSDKCIYKFDDLNLSKQEQEFLNTHQINAISTGRWEPFSVRTKSGIDGIAVDYLKYIEKKLNKDFNCNIANNWSEVLLKIKNKESDITCATTKTKDRAKYALFSKPYEKFPIVIATRNDVGFISDISLLKDKFIAVGKDYTAEKLLKAKYPYLKFVEVETTDEALRLVSENRVYAAVDILPVIAYKINKYSYANLKISAKTKIMFEVRFMVRDDYPQLVSIIDKVIDSMTPQEKKDIYAKWISVKIQNGYSDEYVNNIYLIVGIVIFIVIILIVFLIKDILKHEEIEEELEELVMMDKLTSIFNRYKIDMALNEQIEIAKRYNRDMSIVFFDIDHFKNVNDTYGHKMGDFVLIEIAKVVNDNLRSSDIFGRWGGEEFLIILPETNQEEAYQVALKLKNIIQNHKFRNLPKITCSFGVTQFRKGDTMESIVERVDKLLYFSKENGRNKVSKG